MATKTTKPRQATSIERHFAMVWRINGNGESYIPQLRFALDVGRQWRFDVAFPSHRVAVELLGGIFMRNRNKGHASPKEVMNECEKLNAATLRGWAVLRYHTKDLEDRPVQMVEEIVKLLELRR